MDRVAENIHELKEHLESAAFLVAQEGNAKAAHGEILKALVSLTELSIAIGDGNTKEPVRTGNTEEIRKVSRRLKLWARRPHQINAKILKAFLKLERQGIVPITETALQKAVGDERSFFSNLAQMRTISEKNHGKVFDLNNGELSLWSPIEPAVREYEKEVLGLV